MSDSILDLSQQLAELKARRDGAQKDIQVIEEQLGRAVQLRTKIDGAIEWTDSVYKRELEKKRLEDEAAAKGAQDKLTQPQ